MFICLLFHYQIFVFLVLKLIWELLQIVQNGTDPNIDVKTVSSTLAKHSNAVFLCTVERNSLFLSAFHPSDEHFVSEHYYTRALRTIHLFITNRVSLHGRRHLCPWLTEFSHVVQSRLTLSCSTISNIIPPPIPHPHFFTEVFPHPSRHPPS